MDSVLKYSCPECVRALTRDDDTNYICEDCGFFASNSHNLSPIPAEKNYNFISNNDIGHETQSSPDKSAPAVGGAEGWNKSSTDILQTNSVENEFLNDEIINEDGENTEKSKEEKCPSCNQESFTIDTEACNKICTNCGYVAEEVSLVLPPDAHGSTYVSDKCTFGQRSTMHKNFMKIRHKYTECNSSGWNSALQAMEEFKTHCFNDALISKEAAVFVKSYYEARIGLPIIKKYYCGACAMFIACRLRRSIITIVKVCRSLSLSTILFQKVLTDMLHQLKIKLPLVDKDDTAQFVYEQFQFQDGTDRQLMLSRMRDLTHLLESRAPLLGIPKGSYDWYVAVVFTTWKSVDFPKRKKKMLMKFFRTHKCAASKQRDQTIAQRCIHWIEKFLSQTVEQMSYLFPLSIVGKNSTPDWAVAHLADICLYKNLIISSLPEPEIPTSTPVNNPDPQDEAIFISHPFMDSEQVGEHDIPDSELHQYIHSDSEVKLRRRLLSLDQ